MTQMKKKKRGQYRCQLEEEIIALLFLPVLLFFPFLCLSWSLCPIMLGVRPPNLVMQMDREGKGDRAVRETTKEEEEWGGKGGERGPQDCTTHLSSFYHSFFPSLAFSRVLIITRFCVTSLNKALPCLFHFLPASACVTLQGLTIISSTDSDMQFFFFLSLFLGDWAQCKCLQTQVQLMRTPPGALRHNWFYQSIHFIPERQSQL